MSKSQAAKDKLLVAATKEFAERGYHGVRMEHVAKRAGCNKALVYRYFTDKDGLFKAVLGAQFDQRKTVLQEVPAKLDDALLHWFQRTQDNPDFMRLIQWEALEPTKGELLQEEGRKAYYQKQINILEEMQAAGEISKDIDSKFLFLTLLALTVFPSTLPQITSLIFDEDPESDSFKESFKVFAKQLSTSLKPRGR